MKHWCTAVFVFGIFGQLFVPLYAADYQNKQTLSSNTVHIILLELRVMAKIQKLFSYMILPSEAQPCDLDLHEVHVKTTEMA